LSPGLLADALAKLAAARPEVSQGGYLSSHPSTDERLRRLRAFDPADPTNARPSALRTPPA